MGRIKTELSTEGIDPTLIFGNCQGPCGRPTRKRGVKLEQAPGTMAYGQKGKCKSCCQPGTLKAVRDATKLGDERIDQTVRGLQRYFAQGRYQRGIPPEPSPIAWQQSGVPVT